MDRAHRGESSAFLRGQSRLNLVGDGTGHLALQLQHIGQLALVLTRPEMRVGRRVDQLDADSNTVAGALHRSLEDSVHVQCSRELGEGRGRALEAHDRGA